MLQGSRSLGHVRPGWQACLALPRRRPSIKRASSPGLSAARFFLSLFPTSVVYCLFPSSILDSSLSFRLRLRRSLLQFQHQQQHVVFDHTRPHSCSYLGREIDFRSLTNPRSLRTHRQSLTLPFFPSSGSSKDQKTQLQISLLTAPCGTSSSAFLITSTYLVKATYTTNRQNEVHHLCHRPPCRRCFRCRASAHAPPSPALPSPALAPLQRDLPDHRG
ncbi:uncharacterized protein B0I36DRAFT_3975 [Microdochium trichocladiopsis]|uniref:Uncharacterized protein n=1 Tax=Microdochium trichocladiopsis TaxID=1682393 RepID=A0A9P8YIJ8_9PEZI|nr:uncharacterized protein B0I36DRAFT_3975 [Microdochium trichocladiopsis]KAH7039961.1 hypothetical protein B0I36DRAFT_3975 [Microdochium trichocladiopsis]